MMKDYKKGNTGVSKAVLALLFLPIFLFITGCSKDTLDTDEELIPYFHLFADEAAKRDIIVDYEAARIEGLLQNITDSNVLGQCFRNEEKPKKVIIDLDYWNEASEIDKQFIIFHELGHCFLNRNHDDSKDENNICNSIMHSTPDACTSLFAERKEQYLNELFGI